MRSKKNKAPIEPAIKEENKFECIGCIDLLSSYIFNSTGDNDSD